MWVNVSSIISTNTKAHSKGDCQLDKKKDQLAKDYTILVQACFDIGIKCIPDYVSNAANLELFKAATPDLMDWSNKNFFMLDKLIEDLTKLEKDKSCANLEEHISVNEILRIKDTVLKLVAKLLTYNYNGCKAFYTDKKI